MAKYVWRDGEFVDKQTGHKMQVKPGPIAAPYFIQDIAPYRSPITGEVIGGRAARRDDLKKHDCIDARDLSTAKTVRKEKYARMSGLPLAGRE